MSKKLRSFLHQRKKVSVFIFFLFFTSVLFAQQKITVSGTVISDNNVPLSEVSVKVKGSSGGSVSDAEGKFTIQVSKGSTLVLTFVGYEEKQIVVNNETSLLNIQMVSTTSTLGEVVVIGYGQQKRVNLTGSVATIPGKQLQDQPVSNLTNLIAGRLPGAIATNPSGKPGSGSSLAIRGASTLNNNSPLIVVDGIVRESFDNIDPSDVQSISVLKDASAAAVYGARAANGVFLITTKRGKIGKPTVTYSGTVGIQQPTYYPKIMSPYEYGVFRNIALANRGSVPQFNDSQLEDLRTGKVGTDWYKETFKKTSLITKHNLSINGGSKAVRYNASLGYLDQDGMYNKINFNRYNFRTNIDADINKTLTVGINLEAQQNTTKTPGFNELFIFASALRTRPDVPAYTASGRPYNANGGHPVAVVNGSGYRNSLNSIYSGTMFFEQKLPFITDGLSLKGTMAIVNSYLFNKNFITPYQLYNEDAAGNVTGIKAVGSPTSLNEEYLNAVTKTYNVSLNYAHTFNKNEVSGLLLYEQYGENGDDFSATKADFPNNLTDQLYYSGATNQSVTGTGIIYDRRKSLVGRVNYAFNEKYLLEGSFRYDGSYKFPTDTRFGFFPAVSAGWRISEEPFFKNAKSLQFINSLKLRVSKGLIGNDRVNAFQFQNIYGTNTTSGPIINNVAVSSMNYGVYPNESITWEKQDNNNIGLDGSLFDGKLDFGFDYFLRKTRDILWSRVRSVPATFGRVLPNENYAQMQSDGYEFSLSHHNRIGKIDYNLGMTFSFATNKVTQIDDPANALDFQKQVGRPLGFQAGYRSLGIFQSQQEADSWFGGTQFGQKSLAGDIKYADLNGDKVISATDQTVLSNFGTTPRIIYGITGGLNYKGFDIGFLIQGAAQSTLMMSGDNQSMFTNNEGNSFEYFTDSWTTTNTGAKYPLPWIGPRSLNDRNSNLWLKKSGYARLKSANIGYTLSNSLLKKRGIQQLRLYVSGFNLLTWSQLKIFDPEAQMGSNGGYYPQQRTFSFGVNLSF